MKRFDFANEVAKQLITVASAIITIVIVFYEKFFSHGGYTFALVFLVLFILILSIMFGVMCIGGLTNLVEHQEYIDAQKTPAGAATTAAAGGETKVDEKKDALGFIKLDSCARVFAIVQQALFALALLLFICTAVYDRYAYAKEAPPSSSDDRSNRRERPWPGFRSIPTAKARTDCCSRAPSSNVAGNARESQSAPKKFR